MENEQPPQPPPDHPASTNEPVAAAGSFRRPADYYSAPLPPESAKPGCPRWIPIGCGLGGCLVIILLFVAGTLVVRDTSGRFSKWFVSRLQTETMSMLAADVPPAEKAALQQEFDELQRNLGQKKTSLMQMQGLLQMMNSSISDRKVTREEAAGIRKELEQVNGNAVAPADGETESLDL